MSSFRRVGNGPKTSSLSGSSGNKPLFKSSRGVKPWSVGHLTSVGLNDLDNLLGGGQALGTCLFLQEDRWTRDLARSLLKYWCAEAVSHDHHLIFPVIDTEQNENFLSSNLNDDCGSVQSRKLDIHNLLMTLPRNLHWDKQKKQQNLGHRESLGVLDEGVLDEEEEKAEESLEIAWQYKKSVQEKRLATQPLEQQKASLASDNIFCHSYDLSGKMEEQINIDPSKYILSLKLTETSISGFNLFRELVSLLGDLKQRDGKPIRMVLYYPRLDLLAIALPLLLSYIRKNSLPVVLLIYSSPSHDFKSWSKVSSVCDVVLLTEGFLSRKTLPPPEFRLLQGILTISKVCTNTAATANGGGFFGDITTSKRPTAFLYGFKRDRRKLHISLLHIPPEDYAQGGGSVGSGVRSGAGKAPSCSSNTSVSALDF